MQHKLRESWIFKMYCGYYSSMITFTAYFVKNVNLKKINVLLHDTNLDDKNTSFNQFRCIHLYSCYLSMSLNTRR